jgi:hypothetical protein
MKKHRIIVLLITLFSYTTHAIHRTTFNKLPRIITYYEHDPKNIYHLTNTHLELQPLISFYDHDFLHNHFLPYGIIQPRYAGVTPCTGKEIENTIFAMIDLIMKTKKSCKKTDEYTVLKDDDFNYKKHAGIIILKSHRYPFVIKLFMENPESFVHPYNKGFIPAITFCVSGGTNRYLSGFTRIKNLEALQKIIQQHDYWKKTLDTPRKWFWTPPNGNYFILETRNLGDHNYRLKFPCIYAIVCDEINIIRPLSMLKTCDRKLANQIGILFEERLDRHIDNFVYEKKTKKIIILDTEHYPSIFGLKESWHVGDTYGQWYGKLALKFINDNFLRDKATRQLIAKNKGPQTLAC